MSSFNQVSVQLDHQIERVALSKTPNNQLITVLANNKLNFFNALGTEVYFEAIQRKSKPTVFEWHPQQRLLAIGWETGTVSLFNPDGVTLKDETEVHKNAIALLRYNNTGSRMVTADVSGMICVWRGLTTLSKYQRQDQISQCCFAELNLDLNQKLRNLFFLGGSGGVVTLADDSNHLSEICKKQNSIIIISSSLLLVQFNISTSDKLSVPEKKVKLSIAGDISLLRTLWIGDCLLCTVSSENMIRCWNLDEDENYALTLYDQQIFNDKVVCGCYEPSGRLLIGGTQEGKVVIWKNKAGQFDDKDHWKTVSNGISHNEPVSSIAVGHNLVAVSYQKSLQIMQETSVSARTNQSVQAAQLSSQKIRVSTFQNNQIIVLF